MGAIKPNDHLADIGTTWVATGLVGLGVCLRLWHYLGDRSFWLDELFLALNLQARSLGDLAGPLDWDQMAPLGFLWGEKLAELWFGASELALRALPLIASLLTLTLMYPVARRFLHPTGALTALALCALSPGSIYFAAELKQYSCDEFAALLITGLAVASLRKEAREPLLALGLVGLVMPWVSHPSVFVLAGAGCSLILKLWLEGINGRLFSSS